MYNLNHMKETQDKNWLEWVVLGISSVLVLSIIGFLVYSALTVRDTPPEIVVSAGQPVSQADYVVVPLVIGNEGFQTAKDLRIEVIAGSSRRSQRALLEFPYVPGQSTVKGWATFTQDPGNPDDLLIRILGYSAP